MTQFLIALTGAFFGTIAALMVWSAANPRPDLEPTPGAKGVTLAVCAAFAAVAGLILYLISEGHMSAGLGAIAALMTLATLTVAARALR